MLTDRRLANRYHLSDALGRGGMGTVWRAHDERLQRTVAVKEVATPPGMPPEEAANLRDRVLREARAAGRLNHPNVTTVFDVLDEDGKTWIVMEYVDAPTLGDIVERNGPLSPQRAADIGLGVLAALAAAHRAGIIHRDVKPANVMIPREGSVKLADFGVASVAGDPKLTMTGLILGSPNYMSPEQASETDTTPATDLWGLGATLYFAVEGRAPFERGQAIPTLTAVLHDQPTPMRTSGPLASIISQLLDKDPARRPTAGHLQQELAAVAGAPIVLDEPESAPEPSAATTMVLDTPARGADEWGREEAPPRDDDQWRSGVAEEPRRGGAWLLVIVGAIALLALAAWGLTRPLAPEDTTATPTRQDRQPSEPAATAQDEPAPAAQEDPAEQPDQGQPADGAGEPADGAAEPADQAAEEEPAEEEPPAPTGDVETVEISPAGATVDVPSTWEARDAGGNATDYVDPETGSYLRVDWTDTPGDDAVADWEQQSESFGEAHANYEEISIEPYDYGEYESALWEYRYADGDTVLHAYNLAIAGENYGHALNFQTTEEQWDESQELWQQLVASFEPGGT